MAQLAIKGHATRGKEVIGILEMLGGNNANNCYGKYYDRVYYINENGYIDQDFISHIEQNTKFIIYSLEQFEEKYPYKVGDYVLYTVYGIYLKIRKVKWQEMKEHIFYILDHRKVMVATADELITNKFTRELSNTEETKK